MQFRRWFHPVIPLLLLAILVRVLPGPRTIDDAYITFRYAQNFLSGHGMVYNPGQSILGTTTPLYAILLSLLALPFGAEQAPFPQLALGLNALLDGVTCVLLVALGRRLDRPLAGWVVGGIWALAPFSVTFAIGGMETSLIVAMMVATFYFHSISRPVIAALLAGLSLMVRPDALLFVLPLAFERIRRSLPASRLNPERDPISRLEISAFAGPLLVWILVGTWFYGSPIPQSLTAKVAAYRLPAEAALVRLLQHYATPFMENETFGAGPWLLLALMFYLLVFLRGASDLLRRRPSTWPLLAYPVGYFLAYSIANPLIFRWYLTPPLPMYFLGIFIGFESLAIDLKQRRLFALPAALAILLSLNAWTLRPDHGPGRPAPKMSYIQLELHYQRVGEKLRTRIEQGQVLAAGDIGALGYFSAATILDTIGLISPQSVPYYPLPAEAFAEGNNYAIPVALILDFQPDYLVILESYGRKTLLQDARFLAAYELDEAIPTDIYGSNGMLVFRR